MANRQYTLVLGGGIADVAEAAGSDIGLNSVRVIVHFDSAMSQEQLIQMIEDIKLRIIQSAWPPA